MKENQEQLASGDTDNFSLLCEHTLEKMKYDLSVPVQLH